MFLEDEIFGFVEPVFIRRVPSYDYFAFVRIEPKSLRLVIPDLRSVASAAASATAIGDLRGRIGLHLPTTEKRIVADFRANVDAIAATANGLAAWLDDRLRSHECVSLLGM